MKGMVFVYCSALFWLEMCECSMEKNKSLFVQILIDQLWFVSVFGARLEDEVTKSLVWPFFGQCFPTMHTPTLVHSFTLTSFAFHFVSLSRQLVRRQFDGQLWSQWLVALSTTLVGLNLVPQFVHLKSILKVGGLDQVPHVHFANAFRCLLGVQSLEISILVLFAGSHQADGRWFRWRVSVLVRALQVFIRFAQSGLMVFVADQIVIVWRVECLNINGEDDRHTCHWQDEPEWFHCKLNGSGWNSLKQRHKNLVFFAETFSFPQTTRNNEKGFTFFALLYSRPWARSCPPIFVRSSVFCRVDQEVRRATRSRWKELMKPE